MPVIAVEAQQVTDKLVFWQVYDPAVKCDLSSLAYRSKEGWLLIDPIELSQDEQKEHWAGEPPVAILLTNANHARASGFYRKQYGARIYASAKSREHIDVQPDVLMDGATEIFGLKAIDIPGAAPGECAYLTQEGYLFLGDALINLESHGFNLLPEKYCQDARQNVLSLKSLLDYDFSIVTFAHGLPLRNNAKERMRSLLEGH